MDLYREICEMASNGLNFAFGLVVETQGSTPQKAGAMAVVDDAGRQWGTLGGGLVEAQAIDQVRASLQRSAPHVVEFRLDEAYSREAGPICGGVMRILVACPDRAMISAYESAVRARTRGERGILAHFLDPSVSGAEWIPESEFEKSVRVEGLTLEQALRSERPACTGEGINEAFLEPCVSLPRLLVVGGGHVGQEVVRQAVRLGFAVTVVDDRPEYAEPGLFPSDVEARHGNIGELVAAFPKGRDAYIVLVSKGHRPDAEALEACIHSEVAYLGMIGSERKIRLLRKDFIEREIASHREFDRVIAPIGADIGAVTVPEIGISIAAQLVAARRKSAPLEGALRLRPRSERVVAERGIT